MSGHWKKKMRKCCSLSWQRIVGQLECAATTRPLTDSTFCMLTIKISRPLRQLYFETSRQLSHHANRLPHVHVPRTGKGLYLFTVCAQCRMPSCLARLNSLTSHFKPPVYLPKIRRVIGTARHLRNADSI